MYHQLTREQRYAIYLGLQEKKSRTAIARQIGCSVSTVSREIKRNSNSHGRYIFNQACEMVRFRKEKCSYNHKTEPWILRRALKLLVENDWSPQQISGWLLKHEGIKISHERIYQAIREDETGELKAHTRHGMKYRRHVKRPKATKATNIPNRISIHDRPEQADGTRWGDWELDLIVGKGQKSALVTLTERSTNYILMEYIPNKKPATVAETVVRMLFPFKRHILTITTDNGTEFAHHETIAKRLKTTVYFADSYCSWQKGAIENANKLIRQYFPKGTDFNLFTSQQIMDIQKKINARPRLKLDFLTPKQVFYNHFR